MAISKLLHFWNPRLFVIVDRAVMWERVLEHTWIWEQVESVDHLVTAALGEICDNDRDYQRDIGWYPHVLLFARTLIRSNPEILRAFAREVRSFDPDAADYQAVAVEWFLCGLIEIPPAGISWPPPNALVMSGGCREGAS